MTIPSCNFLRIYIIDKRKKRKINNYFDSSLLFINRLICFQLQDVNWNLNLQISSESVKKQKLPKALLQLKISSKNEDSPTDLIMQFNHEELYEFYQKIEKIQSQLDSLR